jgi:heme oxygenase (mycobilin-producing)
LAATDALTLITVFEVAPQDDASFIAAREPADDGCALYRALLDDADFRFVEIARVSDPARPGAYEVVHEDGTPDGSDGVLLINPFEVRAGADEAFLAGWRRVREVLAAQGGYLGTRLHRSVAAADFRFVNITRWSSPLMFARAVKQPEFEQTSGGIPFARHPALYQAVP